MGALRGNFRFLESSAPRLARLGALAERDFADDAPAALIRLGQLGEFMAKNLRARQGLLPAVSATFDEVLRSLKMRAVLPTEVADCLYCLKRLGNAAVHESAEALSAPKAKRGRRAAATSAGQPSAGGSP